MSVRTRWHSPALALAMLAALNGCDTGVRVHRTSGHVELDFADDADSLGIDGAITEVPRDPNPAIIESTPEDIGTSICPGVRLLRVTRRHSGAPPNAPPLGPRFYGRDEFGRIISWQNVLLCELRIMHWNTSFKYEGAFLIMWRGPAIFEPDSDCDWREPWETEVLPDGRRLRFHEHCRHRARPGPSDRMVTIEVNSDYSRITQR